MTKDEALDLALEALEGIHPGNMTPMAEEYWNKAITAIKQARSAPVQEPVAVVKVLPLGDGHKPMHWADWTNADNPPPEGTLLHTAVPVQEPVACGYDETTGNCTNNPCCYTTPPAAQRTWIGLTDEEFEDIELGCRSTPFGKIEAMRKVEAKLKEKNGGVV